MTHPEQPGPSLASVDMMELLRGIWRRKFFILLVTLLLGGAASFFVLRETPSYTVEAQVLVERWRCEYNHLRPHSSLGYRPPAPEAMEANWLEVAARLTHQVV